MLTKLNVIHLGTTTKRVLIKRLHGVIGVYSSATSCRRTMDDPRLSSFQRLQAPTKAVELETVAILLVEKRREIAGNDSICIILAIINYLDRTQTVDVIVTICLYSERPRTT